MFFLFFLLFYWGWVDFSCWWDSGLTTRSAQAAIASDPLNICPKTQEAVIGTIPAIKMVIFLSDYFVVLCIVVLLLVFALTGTAQGL
jgi:hypothetical protein